MTTKVYESDKAARANYFIGDCCAPIIHDRKGEMAARLESGQIAFFPKTPFSLNEQDLLFLLAQKQEDASYHKNIAYRPEKHKVTGCESKDKERLANILGDFYKQARDFLNTNLSEYSNAKDDFGSFRPIQEDGRKMRLRARNDLIHVDSFSTRPVYGARILRVFFNINPTEDRVWRTSENFRELLHRFKEEMRPKPSMKVSPQKQGRGLLKEIAAILGIRNNSDSPYDSWMLNFHNFLKENEQFQKSCAKDEWKFPPGSTWAVFTDGVSHSVISGQFVLEQTFIIPQSDFVRPECAPINVLKQTYPERRF